MTASPLTIPVNQAKSNGHAPDLFTPQIVSAKQLAKATGYAESTLRQWAREKKIPSQRRGGRVLFEFAKAQVAVQGLGKTPRDRGWADITKSLYLARFDKSAYAVINAGQETGTIFSRTNGTTHGHSRQWFADNYVQWTDFPAPDEAWEYCGYFPVRPPTEDARVEVLHNPNPWHIDNDLIIASALLRSCVSFPARRIRGVAYSIDGWTCESQERNLYRYDDSGDWKVCPTIEAAQRLAFGQTLEDAAKAREAGFALTEKGRAAAAEILKEPPAPAPKDDDAEGLRKILENDRTRNLYLIQDGGDSWHILAECMGDALARWREHEGFKSEDEPDSIACITNQVITMGGVL